MQYKPAKLSVDTGSTGFIEGLIVTLREVDDDNQTATFKISSVRGKTIKVEDLELGEGVEYTDGQGDAFDIRLIEANDPDNAEFLVTKIREARNDNDRVSDESRIEQQHEPPHASDQDAFNVSEVVTIREQLRSLEEALIIRYRPNQAALDLLSDQIAHLSEQVGRQSKREWMRTAFGVFSSIALTVGVSAANQDGFWQLIAGMLGMTLRLR